MNGFLTTGVLGRTTWFDLKENVIGAVSIVLVALLGSYSAIAENYNDDVFPNIFNSNTQESCLNCHHSSLASGLPRQFATVGVDFDTYPRSTQFNDPNYVHDRANARIAAGTMPSAGSLTPDEKATMANWIADGAPFDNATAVTDLAQSITNNSARLYGDFNTNVHTNTTVDGTYFFSWGLTTGYGTDTSATTRNSTATTLNRFKTISGLNCGGETYNFRARATNGDGTGSGINRSFDTLACTAPTIDEGTSINPAATNEGTAKTFSLNYTEDDVGTLTWSVLNQGSKGTFTFDTSTTSNPVTVRYTPSGNNIGSDTAGDIRVTNSFSGQTDTIAVNMSITDDGTDSPVITATSPLALNEDNSASADATTSAASVTISALDPDNAPNYFWDVTVDAGNNANFSVATGATPTLTFTPTQDDFGTGADSFTVRVCDTGVGTGNCDTQAFLVNLTARPDSPDAVADSGLVVVEGAATTLLTVVSNDTDSDSGETATLVPDNVMVTGGTGLTVNGIVGNQISVAHDGAEEVSAQLTYRVKDTTNRTSNTVTVDIIISGVDDPPTGSDFTFGSVINEGMTANEINVIAQSNDPEGATMAVCAGSLSTPTYGTVSVNGSGNVEYNHDGTNVVVASTDADSFTYQVNDANDSTCSSGNTSTANTVSINLAFVNDLPVAVNDTNFVVVPEGGTVLQAASGSILTNDTDEENGTGTGFTVNGNSIPANNAGFTLNNANGTFDFTHDGSETTSTSFTYTVNDGTNDSASTGTVSIQITPVNDPPVINTVAPTVANVFIEEIPVTVYTVSQTDPDDTANFVYDLNGTGLLGDTGAGDMVVSGTTSGVITWTPPRTGNFNQATTMVTVSVTDESFTEGGNNKIDSQVFQIATSPLDTDSDTKPDYDDNCPTVSNVGQTDIDGDTVRLAVDPSGIPAGGDVDPTARDAVNALGESYLNGGDACDEDVDGDGISKVFEDSVAYLSDTDAADAFLDKDGDGISNLNEFLAGTDPAVDSVGPTITVPANVMVGATGYLTAVDIGVATANDGNEGAINVVIPVVDGAITCAQLGSAPDTIDPLRPGSYTVTWHSCDSESNLSTVDQSVTVLPLIATTPGQVTSVPNPGSSTIVRFEVMLNGAVGVDVDVDYTISGSATVGIDYAVVGNPAATGGTITIASGDTIGFIEIDILDSGVPEDANTILLTLSNPVDAVLGSITVHEILVATFNVPPTVDISVAQNGAGVGSTITTGVPDLVTITANAFDANSDLLSYDWSATDNALMPPVMVGAISSFNIDTSSLTPGLYPVEVSVSDGALTTTRSMLLVAQGPIAVILPILDTDGDGITDDIEGFGDEDGDGIPNYLDNVFLAPNVIDNQTGDLANSFIIETDPGLDIRKGTTAVAAGVAGVLISQAQLEANGGQAGGVAVNAVDGNANTSGLYDFEISGLNPSIASANVVIPLPSALQANSVYRKYNTVDGWFTFVQNSNNRVSSAPGELGVCPAPGSALYTSGLTPFHYCVQLTIEDGGPNDADKTRDFVIRDPGGVVVQPEADKKSSDSDGRIGVIHPLLLLIMLLPFAYAYRVQIRREFVRILSRKK